MANNAAVTLNGTGSLNLASGVTETVGTLVIDGILQARGTWNATRDPVHFTGTGALFVTDGPAPDADGAWTSLADGVWNQTGSWQNGDVAKGADKTATFNQSTGATITVDGSRTIGHLVFDGLRLQACGRRVDAGFDLRHLDHFGRRQPQRVCFRSADRQRRIAQDRRRHARARRHQQLFRCHDRLRRHATGHGRHLGRRDHRECRLRIAGLRRSQLELHSVRRGLEFQRGRHRSQRLAVGHHRAARPAGRLRARQRHICHRA